MLRWPLVDRCENVKRGRRVMREFEIVLWLVIIAIALRCSGAIVGKWTAERRERRRIQQIMQKYDGAGRRE